MDDTLPNVAAREVGMAAVHVTGGPGSSPRPSDWPGPSG
jgi:hypothetical protein